MTAPHPGQVLLTPRWSPAPLPPHKTHRLPAGKMSHNLAPPRQDLPPVPFLSIVQHNSLGSWDVFLSLFNSFASALHPLMLFAFKILLFGALAFLPLVVVSPFAPPTPPALGRRLLFRFLVPFYPMLQFFLGSLTGQMLLLLICSGLTYLGDPLPSFIF